MANENKPLNEAKPNEPITAQRWNDMQVALRKEHIEHRHNGGWKDGQFSGEPIAADGLADNAVITARIADAAVVPSKLDPNGDFKLRSLSLAGWGDKLIKAPVLSVAGQSLLSGTLRVSPGDKDSLSVSDTYVELVAGGNPLRFTSVWSSFTDVKPSAAEISNDTNSYKALMIVGNRSAGGVRRVAMWDRVDVMGRLVVGPGGDAGLTVNGNVDATAFKGNDVTSATLTVTAQAQLAQLKVTGASNTGPVNVTGGLTVSDTIVANGGLRTGTAALQAFNRVQVQGGGLHLDGNPLYLRTGVNDQFDLLRWNPNNDTVDLAGFYGVNLGFTKNGPVAGNVTPLLSVRETVLDVSLTGNPLRFSSGWSDFPASGTNRAEISNDTGTYKTLMIIGNRSNNPAIRRVSVWDRLEVNGDLAVTGRVSASSYNIQFYQQTFASQNSGTNGVRDTYINYAGMGFVQVFAAFAVFNGFSLFSNNTGFMNYGNVVAAGAIPQHVFATVLSYSTSGATVRAFCSESDPAGGADNTVLVTLVVIGRTN